MATGYSVTIKNDTSLVDGHGLVHTWLVLNRQDTVLFLGIWEQLNNPSFNSLEFDGIKNEAGRNI